MSWLERLKKVFEVKVRATVFTPSSDRWTENEDRHTADAQEFLLCVRDFSEQFATVKGAMFTLDYGDVFPSSARSLEFKAHLFADAENHGLECVGVSDNAACFKRIG